MTLVRAWAALAPKGEHQPFCYDLPPRGPEDVLYAPYAADMDAVRAIVRAVAPTPVNLVVGTRAGTVPWAGVQAAGVKRLSLGASLYMRVMGNLARGARELLAGDLLAGAGEAASRSSGLGFRQLHQQMRETIGG